MTAIEIGSQTAKRIINIGARDDLVAAFNIGETNEEQTSNEAENHGSETDEGDD